MSLKNFRMNRQQAWTLSNLAGYCEGDTYGEVVINGESYDPEEKTFNFAVKLKDQAPDVIWQKAEQMGLNNGWLFLTMNKDGSYEPMEEE